MGANEMDHLVADILASVATPLSQAVWADEEIESAQRRYSESGFDGPIWNSFFLLRPTLDGMDSEEVYRAHCRELLARTAEGKDSRPATDAEMALAMMQSSLTAPLSTAASCLYFRVMHRSLPALWARTAAMDLDAYEKIHGSKADEYESWLRSKLAQDWRTTQKRNSP